MDDDLDVELVAKARRGDPSAAPFLVSCYGERLLGYARSHAPDLSDTDRERIVELSIEAGVRAIDSFDRARGTLQSWFRGQIRFQTMAWRRATPRTSSVDPDLEQPPPELLVDSPTIEALRQAIARLSHEDQEILAVRSTERLAFGEIAQRLGITEDNARQRHHRALKRLRTEARSEAALRHLDEEVK